MIFLRNLFIKTKLKTIEGCKKETNTKKFKKENIRK